MGKVIRYFAWNAMTVGTFILSSIFHWHTGIVLCGIYFGIEAACYFLINLFPVDKLDDLWPKLDRAFKAYTVPFELLWIALAFYLGHNVIGVCMVITFAGYVELWVKKDDYDKKKKSVRED